MDQLVSKLPATAAPAAPTPPAPVATSYTEPRSPSGGAEPLPYSTSPRQTEAQRSAAEKQLAEDSKNFQKVVFGGFLTNALQQMPVAVLHCHSQYAKDKTQRDRCVARVTVAITIAGVSQGYTVAVAQKTGNDRLRAMQQVTDDMRNDNARIQTMIEASETVIAESQGRLRKLNEDVQHKRVAAEQARAEIKRDQENLDNLNQALKESRSTRDEYVKAAQNFRGSPAERRNLDAEIAAMTAKVNQLEANVKKLSAALVPFSA